ncbi:peroxisomal membrane protein Pex14p [Trichomonascus vanleenenianus]|uniref:peroxisomal membrane protein Pex14p n=1 Tax=Trichomonascus vanleenenianus TaxID=2268995 RepID=UPI003ECB6C14
MREDMIQSAVSFLTDPQVADTSLAKRVEFLESKQLTKEEIEEALKRAKEAPASARMVAPASSVPGASPIAHTAFQPPPPLPQRDWRDYFVMATVTAGVGYGLYQVAKRYVLPMIMPPTPSSLEADKEALSAEFDRVQTLLEQLESDTKEMKEAELEREAKFSVMMEDVEKAVESVKVQTTQRDSDMKLIKSQVESIKDSLPRAIEKHRNQQDAALVELQDELKSLKQLLSNRMKLGGGGPPSASSVPSTIPGLTPPPTSSSSTNSSTVLAPAATGNSFIPAPGSAQSSLPPSGSSTPSATTPAATPSAAASSARTGIPAWQLAAAAAANKSNASEEKSA